MAQHTTTAHTAAGSAAAAGILKTLIPPERQATLARAMLRVSRNAGRHKSLLTRALQSDFRMNGASRQQNEERDVKHITRITGQSDPALLTLARLWFTLQDDLRERLRTELEPYAVEPSSSDFSMAGFWEHGSVAGAWERARAALPDVAEDDLRLAWALLTGRAVLAPEQRPEQLRDLLTAADEPFPLHPDERSAPEHFTAPLWVELLARVDALDEDDAAWDELDDAVLALQRLATTHQSRREARWAPLREALAALHEQPQRVLADLGITESANWVAEQCPPAQVVELAGQVMALADDVAAYAEVQTRMQQLARATFAERRDARQQELDLGNRIIGAYEELHPLLFTADGPRPAAPVSAPVASPVVATPDPRDEQPTASGADDASDAAGVEAASEVDDTAESAVAGSAVVERIGLRSLPEAARALLSSVAAEAAERDAARCNDLLWAFVAAGDVAAAAWVARALGRPALAQGLSAVVGAALATPRNSIGHDLVQVQATVADFGPEAGVDEPASVRLLRLAAALRPSLHVPHSGMRAWLYQDAETHMAGLDTVLDELRRLPVQAADAGGSGSGSAGGGVTSANDQRWTLEQELAKIVAAANVTRSQPPGFNFGGGQPLWRQLTQETALATVLTSVAEDEREDGERVRAAIAQWSDSGWRDAEIQRQHRRCSSGHTSADDPFEGQSLHIMQREISDLLSLGAQWLQHLDALTELDQSGGRHVQQSQAQRERLAQVLPQAWADLCTLQGRSQPGSTQAAARVLTWALQEIANDLRLPLPLGPGQGRNQPQSAAVMERTRPLGSATTLDGALGNRIARLPGVSLDWHDQPSADILPLLPALLAREAQ